MKLLKKENFPLILLSGAIALSPSFSKGEIAGGRVIEIRIEDILLVILGLVWFADFLIAGRKKIVKPPLLLPVSIWLGIGLISVLINLIFMNIELSRGFFYFLKEVEFFFLYFYLFYHIKNISSSKCIIKFWIFLGLINVFWVIYKMSKGLRTLQEYGAGAIGEASVFPSGGFFLILFIFLFNILLFYYLNFRISNLKKMILTIMVISPSLGVFSSISRTCFLGIIFSLILTFLFYSLKKGIIKVFFIGILVLIFVGTIFFFVLQKFPVEKRVFAIDYAFSSLRDVRFNIWRSQISEAFEHSSILNIFLGCGKSIRLTYEESHSQYVRNFIETGIIGSLAFFFLIFSIIRKGLKEFLSNKDPFLTGLSSGVLVSTFTMLFISIPAEAFIVVKINEVYWFFVALTMATSKLYGESQII